MEIVGGESSASLIMKDQEAVSGSSGLYQCSYKSGHKLESERDADNQITKISVYLCI